MSSVFFSPTGAQLELSNRRIGGIFPHRLEGRLALARPATHQHRAAARGGPLPGYKERQANGVFAGLFPTDSDAYPEFCVDALESLS